MRITAQRSRKFQHCTVLVVVMLLAAPGLMGALFHDAHHEWRNELFQMEDNWRNALLRGNANAMSEILAADYMAITSNGMLESREQTLAHMRSGVLHIRSLSISDRKVRFYGGTAVVTCRADVSGTTDEGDITGSYRYTHVWVRESKGPWKIVSFEANRIRSHRQK